MTETFQDSFCRHFQVPPERYIQEVLRRTLTPGARVLRPLLLLVNRDYFSADIEFIAAVGRLSLQSDFHAEAQDFRYNPNNRGLLHRTFRLRVSTYRLRCLVHEVWPAFVSRRAVAHQSLPPVAPPPGESPSPPTAGARG